MLVFLVLYGSRLHPLSNILERRRRPKNPNASMSGKTAEKIIVPTMVFPITLNQVLSKSLSIPPVRPNEKGYSPRSALTRSKRKAVLKYCTKNVTLVVISSFSVSVG